MRFLSKLSVSEHKGGAPGTLCTDFQIRLNSCWCELREEGTLVAATSSAALSQFCTNLQDFFADYTNLHPQQAPLLIVHHCGSLIIKCALVQ